MQDVELQIEALTSLIRHPGWAILSEQLGKRAQAEMGLMRNAKTSDDLLRHTYTYMALADLPGAPRMMADVLTSQLNAHKK